MTEIEKRAKELAGACEATKDDFGYGYRKGLEEGYIIGATKQKTIDAKNYSTAFCDHFCSKTKRLYCDSENKTCTALCAFLQQAMKEE